MTNNRIDIIRADAPELAPYGTHAIGVRTLDLVDRDRIDILNIDWDTPSSEPLPRHDRHVTVEVWYPAKPGSTGSTALPSYMRDGKTRIELHGKAIRDAEPETVGKPFPLVIVSHGHPGNRHLLGPISENIASKGYVVVAIDHDGSSYHTFGPVKMAVFNRPLDQHFVLDQMAAFTRDQASFLCGLVDADNTAILGYSMGGYGALVSVGGGLTHEAIEARDTMLAVPHKLLARFESGSKEYQAFVDPRYKTAILFAPAGTFHGVMNAETLKGIRIPALFVAGSVDSTVHYEDGVRQTWQDAVNSDRSLLTFVNANHNVGAPMGPPDEARGKSDPETGKSYERHYLDAVWDSTRMNNISVHFITAWLARYLRGDTTMDAYLDLGPTGDTVATLPEWKGFPPETTAGLRFERLEAGK